VDEALKLIEKAVTLDPENGAYLDSLGWALFKLGRAEEAEAHVRRAVEKDGKNAVVLDHLGDILRRRGHLREALDLWKRALEGEDEGEELDRAQVERKIREVQSTLNDASAGR
jgi:tetratricopeptide (TPR) repeat protein